ncbi:MAG: glycosyltransferase [Acidobacteriia bacterium]|nr:glycosyltransferase [Terriglobia bacterium]
MKILSLANVYPNPSEPGLGLFVRARLQQVATRASVKVIAPIPLLDYSNPKGKLFRRRDFPLTRQDGSIEVFHPRWLFPPGGTPANVLGQFLRLLPLVRRIRETFPFDLIDAHFGYPEGATAALLGSFFRVPYTITLRGSETAFAASPARRRVLQWAMRRAARIIAVSSDLRDFAVEQGVPPQLAVTIPNGIDPAIFYPRGNHSTRTRRTIVSAGELIEAKGHHLVIEAAKTLLDRGHDLEVVIVGGTARGGPSYEHQLRELASFLRVEERVRFLGFADRETLANLLSAADLFCLASSTEGWPNVVNEALACGTPVVASAVGGVRAMLENPRYGITVPPGDLTALTEALDQALHISWDRVAISNWGQSRTWADVAAEVLSIQQSLVAPERVFTGQPSPYVHHVRY